MPQQKSPQTVSSLTELCQRLDTVLSADPIVQMEQQIKQQQLDVEKNCRWLDQAMALLTQLSALENPDMVLDTIEKVESFVSKETSCDYHQHNCKVDLSDALRDCPKAELAKPNLA